MAEAVKTPIVRLGDIAKIERKSVSPEAIVDGTTYVGLDNIVSGGQFQGVHPVENGDLASSKFVFSEDHILYGKLRPYLTKIAVPSFSGVCSTDILPIRVGTSSDRMYVKHFLRQQLVVDQVNALATGANLPRINPKVLESIELPLPPLDEQRRIAKILDKADELRTKRRQALAHLDALTQSIFHSMFDSLTKKTPLGDIVNVKTGGTPSRADATNYGGVIPWVKTTEVQNEAILHTSEHLTERGLKSSNCAVFPANSVIIAMYGQGKTRGQVGLLLTPAATNQACAVLPPATSVDSSFLFHQLRGMYAEIRALGRGGNQENLNLSLVKGIPIRLPPLEVQQTFATRVAAVERLKESHRKQLAELDTLFASLQHRAFKGEL